MTSVSSLANRAKTLVYNEKRAILGITGSPGSGKTTLARRLVQLLQSEPINGWSPNWVIHVPMDGFHLADSELQRLGNFDRKGAPDTFDSWGYVALLARIAADKVEPIYAPSFERELEQPLAGSIFIPQETRLIITEGNYLLLPQEPWAKARKHLAEVWFCELDADERIRRLIARHEKFGKNHETATLWATQNDQRNADLIEVNRAQADLVISTRDLRY